MSIYAPTLCSTAESKDRFYEELDVAIMVTVTCSTFCMSIGILGASDSTWRRQATPLLACPIKLNNSLEPVYAVVVCSRNRT